MSRVEDAVEAGAAAAEVGLGHLAQLEAGDGAQQGARLGLDPLGVGQVAGVLVGHGHGQAAQSVGQR